MKTWPNWQPDKELKAEHLFGLEDFLLARSTLLEDRCHGLDFFDREVSISVQDSDGTLTLQVRRLRGVTPGGHPIWLQDDASLSETLAAGEERPARFDAAIEINQRERPEKLILLLAPAGQGIPADPRRLDLGQFETVDGEAPRLVRRPMVRRLGAIQPFDEPWLEWASPLSDQIDALQREMDRESGPLRLPLLGLHVEIQRLAFDWPSLNVPQLIGQMRRVNWLRLPPDERPHPSNYVTGETPALEADVTGDNLPSRLAELVAGVVVRRPEEEAQRRLRIGEDVICTWMERYWEARFLRTLKDGIVELHIPNQANPPKSLSLQNKELTYVRSANGEPKGNFMVYPLGPLPVKEGSVFRFRLEKVIPAALDEAEFRFLQQEAKR